MVRDGGSDDGMTDDQAERVIALLTEIRDALVVPVGEPACTHPPETRKDMGSMGEEEWICGLCRHHYGPVKRRQSNEALSQ